MAIKKVGYFEYDEQDRLDWCPEHHDYFYNIPEWIWELDLSDEDQKDFELDLIGIKFCPIGLHWEIYDKR